MLKIKEHISDHPKSSPEWYWHRGLHDAAVIEAETFDFPFDYKRFAKEKDTYIRNVFTLKIDASDAMFDSSVKEIRFFNYKILSDPIDLQGQTKIWWLSDRLIEKDGHYLLEIDLNDLHQEFTFSIKFDRAEVYRA